jgi:hypothetical protein
VPAQAPAPARPAPPPPPPLSTATTTTSPPTTAGSSADLHLTPAAPGDTAAIVHGKWLCPAVQNQPHIGPARAPFPVTYVWYVIDITARPGQAGIGVWSIVKELNPAANDWQLAVLVGDMIDRNGISYNYCTHDGDRLMVPVVAG